MSDGTSSFLERVKNLWAPVVGFMGAVIFIVQFVQLWQGQQALVTWVFAALSYALLEFSLGYLAFSRVPGFYLANEQPRRVPRYSRIYRFATAGFSLNLVLPLLAFAYLQSSTVILIAQDTATPTALFSETAIASPTPTATYSTTPTTTSTLTQSPTPTLEPTATLTDTPVPPPTLTPTAIGGGSGELAFVSDRQGSRNIYLMDALGQGLDRLIGGLEDKNWPRWSPHGTKLAYVFKRTLTDALVIDEPNGSNPLIISDQLNVSSIQYPDWSPQGDALLFSATENGAYELFAIDVDGNLLYKVKRPPGTWNMFGGDWSPDSKSIVFSYHDESGKLADIYLYDVITTRLTRLTDFDGLEIDPAWSPDGQMIAFQLNGDIWVMNADGLNLKQLTSDPSIETAPAWSPDGKLIAYQGKKEGNWDIFVMPADGSAEPVNVTSNPASDEQPTWKP